MAQTLIQKIKSATTITEAMALYRGADDDSEEERFAFTKVLSLAKTEEDLREICEYIECHGNLLAFKAELSQVFEKAEQISKTAA